MSNTYFNIFSSVTNLENKVINLKLNYSQLPDKIISIFNQSFKQHEIETKTWKICFQKKEKKRNHYAKAFNYIATEKRQYEKKNGNEYEKAIDRNI